MIPFLCVQLCPCDLSKTERRTVAARGRFSATCFEAAPSRLSLLQKRLKCFVLFLELLCSCSFCAVWNLPAARL